MRYFLPLVLAVAIMFVMHGCGTALANGSDKALQIDFTPYATYDVHGLRFRYSSDEWYAQPGYGSQATVIQRIGGDASLWAFSGYATEPDLGKTVDAMLTFSKYANGYVFISRDKFYNGATDRTSDNTSAARPDGIRTEYIFQPGPTKQSCCTSVSGSPTAVIQYWFLTGDNTFVVITASCPVTVRGVYGPVFDRIAASVVRV